MKHVGAAETTAAAADAVFDDSDNSDGAVGSDDEAAADPPATGSRVACRKRLGKKSKRDRLTCNEYYKYMIAQRLILGILHLSGKLFQKFLVDAWLKCESNTLEWVRQNQPKLRVDKYSGLKEFLEKKAEHGNARPGVPVVLPSTHTVSETFSSHSHEQLQV